MNYDDDDFAEAEPVPARRSLHRSEVDADTGIDDFADEFPEQPAAAQFIDEFPDEPDGIQDLLFPEGWDRQNNVNRHRKSSELMPGQLPDGSFEPGRIPQAMLEEYEDITERIRSLNYDKSQLRSRILRSLEAGYGVEPGLMELKHHKRETKSRSNDAIISVLGVEAAEHLIANLPTYERDVITVRQSKPRCSKGAK